MTCQEAEPLLAKMTAEELTPEERNLVSQHLLDCRSCREDLENAKVAWTLELPPKSVPDDVAKRTLTSIYRVSPLVRVLQAATAAAAILAAILLASSGTSEPEAPSAAPVATAPADPPPPPGAQPRVLAYVPGQEPAIGRLTARDRDGNEVGPLSLRSHSVTVEILDGIAKTTVLEDFENHTGSRLEGTFIFPLPGDASITRLALEVNGKMEEGTVLERNRAREVFESIVSQMKDPALLEWMPGGLFKCRVFPIEPHSTKKVLVSYTQTLASFENRMRYVYPLASEKTDTHPPGVMEISVTARFSGKLATISSPSHPLNIERPDTRRARGSYRVHNTRPERDFVLALAVEEDEVRFLPHKTLGDDGYFALFVTPKGKAARKPAHYAIVLDVSASMSRSELEVAKTLVRALMKNRIAGDRFEIIAHNVGIVRSGDVSNAQAEKFLGSLEPMGASDVAQAILSAPDRAEIIYIGEGNPTFGVTDPAEVLRQVKGRKIRTVGIGSSANVDLLRKLGGFMQVSPNDAVELRATEIARTLGSAVVSGLKVEGGENLTGIVGIRDVFFGERLVVLGRYRGMVGRITVSGRGFEKTIEVTLPFEEKENGFVRRLWAKETVSRLLAEGGKEKEVTELGVRHQIMTPYTSFLVLESEKMWKDYNLERVVQRDEGLLGKEKEESEKKIELAMREEPETEGVEGGRPLPEARSEESIRDQYEAQLRRERRLVTIKGAGELPNEPARRALTGPQSIDLPRVSEVVEPFRQQRDWNGVFRSRGDRRDPFDKARATLRNPAQAPQVEPGSVQGFSYDVLIESTRRKKLNRGGAPLRERYRGPMRGVPQPDAPKPSMAKPTPAPAAVPAPRPAPPAPAKREMVARTPLPATKPEPAPNPPTTPRRTTRATLDGVGVPPPPPTTTTRPSSRPDGFFGKIPSEGVTLHVEGARPKSTTIESNDLRRREFTVAKESSVLRLKHSLPPTLYTAKVESNKQIFGRPPQPEGVEGRAEFFLLRKLAEDLLTRDPVGKHLGSLNFDAESHSFVVMDRKEVLSRIEALLKRLDVSPPEEYRTLLIQAAPIVSIDTRGMTVREAAAEIGRQTGWTVSVDARTIPVGAKAPVLHSKSVRARPFLDSFAELGGFSVWPLGADRFRLSMPPKISFGGVDIEASAMFEGISRHSGHEIILPETLEGRVSVFFRDVPWTQAASDVARTIGYAALWEPGGRLRVIHPDRLLQTMETRVFRLSHIRAASLLEGFHFYPVISALLSRDREGKVTGSLSLDVQTSSLIVIDTDEVRTRILEMAELLDIEPGRAPGPFRLRTEYPARIVRLVGEARAAIGAPEAGAPRSRGAAEVLSQLASEVSRFAEEERREKKRIADQGIRVSKADLEGRVNLSAGSRTDVRAGDFYSLYRDERFIAVVRIDDVAASSSKASLWDGLTVGRILPGDLASRITGLEAFLGSLPSEVKLELASRLNLRKIRSRMRGTK